MWRQCMFLMKKCNRIAVIHHAFELRHCPAWLSISACPFPVNRLPPRLSFSTTPNFSSCCNEYRIKPPDAFELRDGFIPRRFRPP